MERIVIGNDHAATKMKEQILEYVKSLGYEVVNVGIDSEERCDYPDYAYKACKKVVDKKCKYAILICGSGVGMSIAANKIKGIRACVCSEPLSAHLCREHNDCNVICFGARVIGIETAKEIVKAFLSAKFLEAHHTKRIAIINDIESGSYNA